MSLQIPKFRLFGEDDQSIKEKIQPTLKLRTWNELNRSEKEIALQEVENRGWISNNSIEVYKTISYLNNAFLRKCPGKHLHKIVPTHDQFDSVGSRQKEAAYYDFRNLFLADESTELVYKMFSKLAQSYIDWMYYEWAEKKEVADATKTEYINKSFLQFDSLSNCFNHIFEQFGVNVLFTRSALVPRQDEIITEQVFKPVMTILSNPKWKAVSDDLADLFSDYHSKNYSEVITKAHASIQRFLQILVGEAKNGKGEMGKLFNEAKNSGLIPTSNFSTPIINAFQNFIVSERANNSTAKPASKDASHADALLAINVTMVFLQHCLQKN